MFALRPAACILTDGLKRLVGGLDMKTTHLAAGAAACAMLLSGTALAADVPAFDFDGAPTSLDSALSLGFSFTATAAATVTALGYYDDGGDGFATAHEVGIFDSNGNLLASADLSAGASDRLIGQFRYAGITPLTLAAGQNYVIAATTHGSADPWAYGNAYPADATVSNFHTTAPIAITANSALFLYQDDNNLRNPTEHYSNYTFYAGPNFLLGVPEPTSWALMLGGFGLMGAALRNRRHSTVSFG